MTAVDPSSGTAEDPEDAVTAMLRLSVSQIDSAVQGLVGALHSAMAAIRELHPEVPETVTLPIPTAPSGVLAYHWAERWTLADRPIGEICLAADYLDRGALHVLMCLLHESVHAAHSALDIRGTSRQGRYHNRRFAEWAERFGLVVEPHHVVGHVTPGLQSAALDTYAPQIAHLDEILANLRRAATERGASDTSFGSRRPSAMGVAPYVSATCRCESARRLPRRIRMARGAWEIGEVFCSVCESPFLEEWAP